MAAKLSISKSNSIIFVSSAEFHSGAEEMLIYYMEAASRIGFRPVLVLPKKGWMTDQCVSRNIPFEIVSTIPRPFTHSKWVHLRSWLWNAIQIARLAKKWNAVLVHSNSIRIAFHGGLGARLAGIPSIAHVHDVIKLPYQSRLMSGILRYLVDFTICVSDFVQDQVVSQAPFLKDKTCRLYNGTFPELYMPANSQKIRQECNAAPDDLLFGVIASMIRMKGQKILIQAFEKVIRSNGRAKLIIVGGPLGNPEQTQYEKELKDLAVTLGLENKVIFTGWQENVVDYLQAMDIFVFTPTSPEAAGMVLVHASALGKPIIASCIGGIPEIIKDQNTGLLVEPGNLNELASTMLKLIEDEQLRHLLGKKAISRYHDLFTFEDMKVNLKQIYVRVLKCI